MYAFLGDLQLDYAEIRFPVSLLKCRIAGTTSLVSCQIPMFALTGSWTGPIRADGARIGNSLFLDAGFRSVGTVSLRRAQIVGDLDCIRARFICKNGVAIDAQDISVGGDIRLRSPTVTFYVANSLSSGQSAGSPAPPEFQALGDVRLSGARVGGDVSFVGGEFLNHGRGAIYLNGARISGGIYIHQAIRDGGTLGPRFRLDGIMVLTDTKTERLDFYEDAWPSDKALMLTGLEYNSITPSDPVRLLRWLDCDDSGTTQPYRQLAKVLREAGGTRGSIIVLKAMEAKLTTFWMWPIKAPIGYGYDPENAIWGLLGLTGIGALIYWRAQRMGEIVPSDKDAYAGFKSTPSALPSHYPQFQPVVFSLENTFPLVKLGQTDRWQCDPKPTRHFSRRRLLRWTIWIQIILGWLLATLFLAAVSGIVQHN